MAKKYYIAYGSNLNIPQMKLRCPGAVIVGTGELDGWELLFKGSGSGYYLTIERRANGRVPFAVWSVKESDVAALDRYEGYPSFYYKKEMTVRCRGRKTGLYRKLQAFVYIMHEERQIGVPGHGYVWTCLEGYRSFGFDENILLNALNKSTEVCGNEK